MIENFHPFILQATAAKSLERIEVIQSLWSGYGEIVRYRLVGAEMSTVVLKHIKLPKQSRHPRGWNTDLSHQRKIKSYRVEMAWYSQWNQLCSDACRVPHCLAHQTIDDEMLIVLEDLDAAGFPLRKSAVSSDEINACLQWLANFHATFMHQQPKNLWQTGSYWHLETRPDELQALEDQALKQAASSIDLKLRQSPFQTFVHGDAKLANFCFSQHNNQVAAVDFQYVGGGCGMKDVAYFIGSCLTDQQCQQQEIKLLDNYFHFLKTALKQHNKKLDMQALEHNWRQLYPLAWTDFHRFLKGWSPDHWKINSYSERLAREVIEQLNSEQIQTHTPCN